MAGRSLAIAYSMKKKKCHGGKMASGGTVKSGDAEMDYAKGGEVDEMAEMPAPKRALPMSKGGNPYSEMEESKRSNMAMGGDVDPMTEITCPHCSKPYSKAPAGESLTDSGYQDDSHDMGMISRIMAKRMSRGGQVANSDKPIADGMKAEYDDLHLRDDLEFSDTGANSGDEISHDESYKDDEVSRAMAKRKKAKRD